MKIFLNDNIRSYSLQRGVGRYFWHITDGLIKHFQNDVTIFSPARRDFSPAKHIRSFQLDFKGSYRLQLHKITDRLAARASDRENASVFFSPYYGTSHPKAPEIFVVHDMIHALPEYCINENPFAMRFRMEVKGCLERAHSLIAVSANTANDIVKCYPHIDAGKIFVVHHGVDSCFFQEQSKLEAANARPFFLFVGNRGGYKNFLRLITAFANSGLAESFDMRVISPIKKPFNVTEQELISKYNLAHAVHMVPAASELDLQASYASAAAFIYPSEYEGFGMPILEAMASGAIVATSNCSSMPEVGGDAALYFNPLDTDSISDCLLHIANMSSREQLEIKRQGVLRAQSFSWQKSVGEVVRIINQVS